MFYSFLLFPHFLHLKEVRYVYFISVPLKNVLLFPLRTVIPSFTVLHSFWSVLHSCQLWFYLFILNSTLLFPYQIFFIIFFTLSHKFSSTFLVPFYPIKIYRFPLICSIFLLFSGCCGKKVKRRKCVSEPWKKEKCVQQPWSVKRECKNKMHTQYPFPVLHERIFRCDIDTK